MLDKRLLWTGVAVCIVAAAAIVAATPPFSGESAVPLQEPVADVAVEEPPASVSEPQAAYQYILREYNGYIAVFTPGSSMPELVLNKLVKHLPDYDRIQLQEGIEIRDEQELFARIEDFTS